jgi:hypothetical protein
MSNWKNCTNHHHGCDCHEHEWEEREKEAIELVKKALPVLKSISRGDPTHMTMILWPTGLLDECKAYLDKHKKAGF